MLDSVCRSGADESHRHGLADYADFQLNFELLLISYAQGDIREFSVIESRVLDGDPVVTGLQNGAAKKPWPSVVTRRWTPWSVLMIVTAAETMAAPAESVTVA